MARTLTAILHGHTIKRSTPRTYGAAWLVVGRRTEDGPEEIIVHGFARDVACAIKAAAVHNKRPGYYDRSRTMVDGLPTWTPYLYVRTFTTEQLTEYVSKPRTPKQEG